MALDEQQSNTGSGSLTGSLNIATPKIPKKKKKKKTDWLGMASEIVGGAIGGAIGFATGGPGGAAVGAGVGMKLGEMGGVAANKAAGLEGKVQKTPYTGLASSAVGGALRSESLYEGFDEAEAASKALDAELSQSGVLQGPSAAPAAPPGPAPFAMSSEKQLRALKGVVDVQSEMQRQKGVENQRLMTAGVQPNTYQSGVFDPVSGRFTLYNEKLKTGDFGQEVSIPARDMGLSPLPLTAGAQYGPSVLQSQTQPTLPQSGLPRLKSTVLEELGNSSILDGGTVSGSGKPEFEDWYRDNGGKYENKKKAREAYDALP
tara:strand:+ start:1177 stop:2127 length:951 start_codon:yes stop_codon:yes gene_type:complete